MTRHDRIVKVRTKPRAAASTEGDLSHLWHAFSDAFEHALELPQPARSRWHRAGVGTRTERFLDVVFGAVLLTFAVGWSWSIAPARAPKAPLEGGRPRATASIGAALTDPNAPTIAYLTDATV